MKYFVATNELDVVHYGEFDPDLQELTTTQPVLNLYDTKEEMVARLEQLGVVLEEPDSGDRHGLESFRVDSNPVLENDE